MFGPNYHYPPRVPESYCHRSPRAVELHRLVRERFRSLFGLEHDILLIPGPATLAMQVVLDSVEGGVTAHGNGRFDQRWREMCPAHNGNVRWLVYCLLETSESRVTRQPTRYAKTRRIVDAVSGFPYYPMPEDAAIFVTTGGKLLGCPPGLAIVGVKPEHWVDVKTQAGFRYTDLRLHFRDDWLTTGPTHVLEHLAANLTAEFFDAQARQIDEVCAALEGVLPPELYIGEKRCPVITLKRREFEAVYPGASKRLGLYPETRESDRYHIFTYSEPRRNYDQLLELLSHAI